jgi:NADPH:quinone reductase-like Zn-dependent oxidoreductase
VKALVLKGVGQSLSLENVPDPTPEPGEAVVAIRCAALNHRDVWIQKGLYAGLKFPIILGSDGAGVVTETGSGVDPAWRGKEVIINPSIAWGASERTQGKDFRILGLPDNGTFAERVKVPAPQLVSKPTHLDFAHAAALPLAGLTAYRALFSRAGLVSGERVLVTGIGGGVALFALQFALAAGATVYVTSGSDEKLARAKQLGAAGGANYRNESWAEDLKNVGFDVIIDSAGGKGFSKLTNLAAPGGRIAFFGATLGNPPELDLRRIFWKQLNVLGSTMGSPADFAAMVRLVEQHKIQPLAETLYPLSEGNEALAAMDSAKQFGKIVLTVAQ